MAYKINSTFRRLATDGVIDRQDVGAIINAAKDGGRVTPFEKKALQALLLDPRKADKFSAEAKLELEQYLGVTPPPPPVTPGVARDLGQNPAGEKVVLKDGFFVADADAALPATAIERGDSCFRVASLIAASDPSSNVFAKLSTTEKSQVLQQLKKTLNMAPAGIEIPDGFENALQAQQARASVATTLLELMRSADIARPDERLLQDEILKTYAPMAERETSSVVRDSMVFQLHNNKDCLVTAEQRAISDTLMCRFAPTQPPYDEWFKDGNKQLNVVCHTGMEFFKSEVNLWKGDGYKVVTEETYGPVVLEKNVEHNGVETTIRLTMVSGSGGTFDDMDDENTHIVAYSGHANWGRAIPRELQRAPDEVGQKLVIVNQCCGRGMINKFRDKYTEAQLITTRNSSIEPEDFATFSKTLTGIAERRPWVSISNKIRDEFWQNRRDNYLFPNDAQMRMRARDRDHDGVADVVDRLVNFNTFRVQEDTDNEFVAQDSGKRVDVIDGTKVHEAVSIINTTTKFSDFMAKQATGDSFVGTGYFQPDSDNDAMVRIIPKKLSDVEKSYQLSVNSKYAHASEEAIKAEAFFTLAQTPPFKLEHDSALDTCLKGLILVAHSLDVDSGQRDSEIFKALCKYHDLPEIELWDVKPCVDVNHVYAGSAASITKLKEKLGAEKLAAIETAVS